MTSERLRSEAGQDQSGCFRDICGGKIDLVKDHFSGFDSSAPLTRGYYSTMRTIKLTRDQFRIWRSNIPAGPENALGGRDQLKKELLATNGGQSFKLMSPMARFIGTVRGENSTVGSAPMGTPNGAPSPESCVCKQYAGTQPGEHHPVCQHRQAWENGKGIAVTQPTTNLNPAMNVVSQLVAAPLDTTPRVQHMQVPAAASTAPVSMPTTQPALTRRQATPPVPAQATQPLPAGVVMQVPAVVALISPEQCDCRQFTKPTDADPKQHHFICQHYDKWKTAHPTKAEREPSDTEKPPPPEEPAVDYVLADLDTRSVLRAATSEEIEQARAEEAKSGSPLITLDEGVYAVVPQPRQTLAVANGAA